MPIHCLYIDFHRKPPILKPATDRGTKYSQELQNLQKMLHFPEEVALLLTETEHALFTCVPPAHYIRQVTTDISRGSLVYHKVSSVEDLIQRFNEVLSSSCYESEILYFVYGTGLIEELVQVMLQKYSKMYQFCVFIHI